jgi:hypothetical protein
MAHVYIGSSSSASTFALFYFPDFFGHFNLVWYHNYLGQTAFRALRFFVFFLCDFENISWQRSGLVWTPLNTFEGFLTRRSCRHPSPLAAVSCRRKCHRKVKAAALATHGMPPCARCTLPALLAAPKSQGHAQLKQPEGFPSDTNREGYLQPQPSDRQPLTTLMLPRTALKSTTNFGHTTTTPGKKGRFLCYHETAILD